MLEVPPIPVAEGVKLLLVRAYGDIDIPKWMEDDASKIVCRLGGLPLAIDQAGAYIKSTRLPVGDLGAFLTIYETCQAAVLQHTPPHFWKYGTIQIHGQQEQDQSLSAFTTWELSLERFRATQPRGQEDVAHFLTVSAFLGPAAIPEGIFRAHWERAAAARAGWMSIFRDQRAREPGPRGGPGVGPLADGQQTRRRGVPWSADTYWDVVHRAHELSLLGSLTGRTADAESSFSLHPLIRDWLQLREAADRRQKYTAEGIEMVANCIRSCRVSGPNLAFKSAMLQHMDGCLVNDRQFSPVGRLLGQNQANWHAASWFADFYDDMGRYQSSQELHTVVLGARWQELGPGDPETMETMNNLAIILKEQGKYVEAEKMYRETVWASTRVQGPEHPATLTAMHNLACVLEVQGQKPAAEKMHRETLNARRRVVGPDDPGTWYSAMSLGRVLEMQGQYREAEPLLREAAKKLEQRHGIQHRDTLTAMAILALVLAGQGHFDEAETIGWTVLRVRERELGAGHPDIQAGLDGLAATLDKAGKWDEAEAVWRRVIELRTTSGWPGPDHPATLASLFSLGRNLRKQGRFDEAAMVLEHVVARHTVVSGPAHAHTLVAIQHLAAARAGQGRADEAARLRARADTLERETQQRQQQQQWEQQGMR